jgi:HEAT repeats
MSTTHKSRSRAASVQVSRVSICCALLCGFAFAQAPQSQPETPPYAVNKASVPDAIAKVKSGDFGAIHVDLITRAGAAEAIPALKEQFLRIEGPILKAKIAAGLIRLGDKDDTYWNFLVKDVTPVLESDAPDFMNFDPPGKSLPGPSPEFIAWAKAHNVSPDSVGADSVYVLPGKVAILGWSRDPRAIPLLRQALLSPNHMVETAASMGLAEIGDKDSIPLIIDACRKAPADSAAVIAAFLVYFDDNTAQTAVDQYIPKDRARLYRDATAYGKTTPFSAPLN